MKKEPATHHLWDEHDLFGEGYPTQRRPKVVDSLPTPKKDGVSMTTRLPKPTGFRNSPPLWVCNALKEHAPDGLEVRKLTEQAPTMYPCRCRECLCKDFPYLEEGPVHITSEEWREKLEEDYVGMYEPERYIEIFPSCAVCGSSVRLDGREALRFQRGSYEVVHVHCLSDESRQQLNEISGGAFVLPYLIRERTNERVSEPIMGTVHEE